MARPVLSVRYKETTEDYNWKEQAESQLDDLHVLAEQETWEKLPTAHKLSSCLYTSSFGFVRDYRSKTPLDISRLTTSPHVQRELCLDNSWMTECTRDELDEAIKQSEELANLCSELKHCLLYTSDAADE